MNNFNKELAISILRCAKDNTSLDDLCKQYGAEEVATQVEFLAHEDYVVGNRGQGIFGDPCPEITQLNIKGYEYLQGNS